MSARLASPPPPSPFPLLSSRPQEDPRTTDQDRRAMEEAFRKEVLRYG